MQRLIHVLWPSFLVAIVAEGLFFTAVDPMELSLLGHTITGSRLAVYSVGFFCFWTLGAMSSALTCFFQRSAAEINRCPLEPTARPEGCPKREDPGACCG
ncbi:MAG: hypothetical protein KIT73_09815 [Burkholderiales bacterium]|nr:hypothetical protein [Burkholderiales bacterium]